MANRQKPKGRSRETRSEIITVRVDPKLRYISELAARKQRRTLSSYIEWAMETSLQHVPIESRGTDAEKQVSMADVVEKLWHVDEVKRFINLALLCPELLTYEEQILWNTIKSNDALWRGRRDERGKWRWKLTRESLFIELLQEHWEDFQRVASGNADESILPRRRQPKVASRQQEDDNSSS
jgi:hypothetical protein